MQTSSKSLKKQAKKEVINQFITLLSDISNPKSLAQFSSDFFTKTELLVFAKRLAIAWLLNQGKSYQEIKNQLKVSSATISSVAEIKDEPGMQLAMKKIKEDKKFDEVAKKIWQLTKIFKKQLIF